MPPEVARPPADPVTPCDCCGASTWEYEFSESTVRLGRCNDCGLHYVTPMPDRDERIKEIRKRRVREDVNFAKASQHRQNELRNRARYQTYLEAGRRFAPAGKWLDIGCGTGILIEIGHEQGLEFEGIELTTDRCALARRVTGTTVYDRPLEDLRLPAESFAGITMIDVFSHLTSPTETLREIRRLLRPRGVFVLRTGEIGPGVQRHHELGWDLGDHLFFLGENTIERYAEKLAFHLVFRQRDWRPAVNFSRERFQAKGRSPLRNLIKAACLYTPGILPLLRCYMLRVKLADSPCYHSTLVLQKPEPSAG